jgi:DNA-binding response OmpR family regulator
MAAECHTTRRPVPSILLVAADPEIREFYRRELEQDGYRVLLEECQGSFPEAASPGIPDLVILDTHMPRANGLALMRQLMVRLQVPVILFSVRRTRTFAEKHGNLAELRKTVARELARRGFRPRPAA